MGRRIALECIVNAKAARLYDLSAVAAQQAPVLVRKLLEKRVAEGRSSRVDAHRAMAMLSISSTLPECVAAADLIIEAVPENVELKRAVFAEIDKYCSDQTLLISNTSSIPASWIADVITRPGKFLNANFGTPDHLKVEIMGHPGTDTETFESAVDFIKDIGLVPIVIRGESVGYALNRIWRMVKKEVLSQIELGHVTAEDVDRGWMLDWGTGIGPCGLMDEVGLDVVRDIEMVYFRASGNVSDRPPSFLIRMIESGKLGVKSSAGFYNYPNPSYKSPGWLRGGIDIERSCGEEGARVGKEI